MARDLAPLGYTCVVLDADPKAGGMIRTQIPRFRLPESVIDEECGYILDLGVEFRGGKRIDSLKALLGEVWDAVFVGSSPLFNARRIQVVHFASYHRVPASYSGRLYAEIGRLIPTR